MSWRQAAPIVLLVAYLKRGESVEEPSAGKQAVALLLREQSREKIYLKKPFAALT